MQERQCHKNCCTSQQSTTPCYSATSGQNTAQNGTNTCPPHRPSHCAYALFYQLEEINVAANDGIDFPITAAASAGDFTSDGNQVQILNPGVYYISYTIHIPAGNDVNTTFALQTNRQNVAGTERVVNIDAAGSASLTVTAETILTVCGPISVRVASSSAATITGAENEALATLFIHQLA